jgi:hypothetical protein
MNPDQGRLRSRSIPVMIDIELILMPVRYEVRDIRRYLILDV